MATGETITTGELMATGEAEVQSIQTTLDGGIVASRDRSLASWPSTCSLLESSLLFCFLPQSWTVNRLCGQ